MKNKILILISTILFIISMIILSIFLNNRNKDNFIGNEEENAMEVMKVTSENFEEEVLKSDKTVLIDFYADWCGPCKMFGPIVESVASENEDIKVVKINVDNAQDIAMTYQVMSIPTAIVIKNGQEVKRSVGLISKSDLLEMVK